MNMGLHGGLRLDRLMMLARGNVKRGDILVMPLEPNYYDCSGETWDQADDTTKVTKLVDLCDVRHSVDRGTAPAAR